MSVNILQELFRLIFKTDYKEKIRHLRNFYSVVLTYKNWWIYYLDYFQLINKSPIIFNLWNGKVFLGFPHRLDGIVINEIWGIKNIYIEHPISIGLHDIVVDIGAHKGYFSVYASCKASRGYVYAFEPFPSNYNMLRKNLKINKCINVKSYQLGIAETQGKKKLYLGYDTIGNNSLVKSQFNNFGESKITDISVIRLQDIFEYCKIDQIDFLKMDIEGAEYDIFLNTPKSVFSKIKYISMEYHNINNMNGKILIDIFKKNQFKVKAFDIRKEFGMLYAIRK